MMRQRGKGLAAAWGVILCALFGVVALVVLNGQGTQRSELLCSDERCGEGSKLSRQNAVKDLDKYADKAELKDRLDELQTVMERGMTHKSAAKQLNTYFNGLDRDVQSERRYALRQARREGQGTLQLSPRKGKHVLPSLHSSSSDALGEDDSSSDAVQGADIDAGSAERDIQAEDKHQGIMSEHSTHDKMVLSDDEQASEESAAKSEDNSLEKQRQSVHKGGISSSEATLNSYFDDQARKIKEENTRQLRSSKLSAAQADEDLNKYFDSLQAQTKNGKMHSVVKKLDKLSAEVQNLQKPLDKMTGDTKSTRSSLRDLESQNTKILDYDQREHEDEARATARAVAKAAARAAARVEASVEADKRETESKIVRVETRHKGNPRMKMFGLPPQWEAYKDRNTKFAYFYDEKTGKSTWESPKGPQISLKDMPSDWDAFKDAKGNIYYANKDTGVSTFDDPRLGPGASVLKLLQTTERARRWFAKLGMAKTAKLAAQSAHHGVFGHQWPRSQWADRPWWKFLTDSNVKGSGSVLTNQQQLRMGGHGSEHALTQRASSSNY